MNIKKYHIIIILLVAFSLSSAQVLQTPATKFALKQKDQASGSEQPGFKAKYVLLSLILPGAGEYFMGHHTMAKIFVGTEALLWAGYLGARAYANELEGDFQAFAAVHADVNPHNKSDQYWIDIGSAENIYVYNEQKRVERQLKATYPETAANYWQWDSRANRSEYTDLRIQQHDWKRRTTFVISGMILNRLVSAIDVIRIIKKEKRESQSRMSRLYFDYRNNRLQGEVYRLNLSLRW